MSRLDPKKLFKHTKHHLLPAIFLFILIFLCLALYEVFMQDKFYPITKVGDVNISFLTTGQAIVKLSNQFAQKANFNLPFQYQDTTYYIDLRKSSPNIDYSFLENLFLFGRAESIGDRIKQQLSAIIFKNLTKPNINLDLDPQIEIIAKSVLRDAQNAQISFTDTTTAEGSASAKIDISDAINGQILEKDALKNKIINYLISGQKDFVLPIQTISPKVSTLYALKVKALLENIQNQPITLIFEEKKWILDTKQLLAILNLDDESEGFLDKDKTYRYLAKIATEIDQEVEEGLFEFNKQTKRVAAFRASRDGRKLDLDKTYLTLLELLGNPTKNTISLYVTVIKPKIQTQDINDLGIKELIGQGISNFAGSITNRVYNIGLASSRLNGVLIPPGETFSFNQTVGDISASSGYKQAYVIKSGRTVLDDGGGVCQVSTTTFRAVLNSGLPVVQRVAHAYRVGYYEQGFPPGLDATIFSPSVDFKFNNDTGHYILIQAYTVGANFHVDFYGTTDGRVTTISKSSITNQTPPPEALYQDDPTLAKGEVKQVDWPAWGANVSFKRTVMRGGETLIDETFKSNYRPWQAVYLVGTKE